MLEQVRLSSLIFKNLKPYCNAVVISFVSMDWVYVESIFGVLINSNSASSSSSIFEYFCRVLM